MDRLEYLLPCGHVSVSLVCFHCAIEEFAAKQEAAGSVATPAGAAPSPSSGAVRPLSAGDRLEYLLPCGHRSAGPVCFLCARDAFAGQIQSADEPRPRGPVAVPRELTISVTYPPHIRRFAARRRRR